MIIRKKKNIFNRTTDQLSFFKSYIVGRLFWGRSSLYKNIIHSVIISVTLFITLTGLVYRVSTVSSQATTLSGETNTASDDLLQQGASLSAVLRSDINKLANIPTDSYKVKPGDTLTQIALNYKVSVDTIRWANPNLISPFTNDIQVGWDLVIPKINGVLYTVKPGQTLDQIIALTSVNNSEANKFNIVEFNELQEPYTLEAGQRIFIPDGNLRTNDVNVDSIPRGVFTNPLSDPSCIGYTETRGFTYYHDGADLAKWDGCIVSAVAIGYVYYAGWEVLSGYTVKIDHGGGIHSYYYHLSDIYAKVGDRIQQGAPLGYMGSTGNSTGTHLHFTLKKDNIAFDPAEYVPF